MTPRGSRSSAAPAIRARAAAKSAEVRAPVWPASRDLDEARLLAPVARPGSVSRTPLVNRLRASGSHRVVTLLAPSGYGKTTLLGQWADRDERPFAWVSIDEAANDPALLFRYVTTALSRIDSSVLTGLGSRRRLPWPTVRSLTPALFSIAKPFVLVLDDAHLLRSTECADAVTALAEHVPEGSTLVLSGRTLPRVPMARLRATRGLYEIGGEDLALTPREVELLLRGLGIELAAPDLAELADRTEGWAAGLYFAALVLKDEVARPASATTSGGSDRFVADYFDFEHLSRLSPKDVRFLTRTAVLDTMCGPLCDTVLKSHGSARKLESIEKSNLFLVPLDRRRAWYRYHHEFRAFLRAELERREPELVLALNRRAAAWCEANDAAEAAVPYARAARDSDRLARLVSVVALPVCSAGRATAVESWLRWFDDGRRLRRYPEVCVLGAWVHALRGRAAAAEQWLSAADKGSLKRALPDGSPSIRPWTALVRAGMCRDGVEQMRCDAEVAVQELGATSRWRPIALLLRGAANLLLGENDFADMSMAEAAEVAESVGATDTGVVALAERSLLAVARRDETGAEALALRARGLVDEGNLVGDSTSALALAVSARRESRAGNLDRARTDLAKAEELRPLLTHALPWHSVQASLELARVHVALLDGAGARPWLARADEILRWRPDLGALPRQLNELVIEAGKLAESREGRASTLTAAELRLLPFLSTHLSFREIGEHLYVSRNTVKTQAISAYRKLGVSSRSEAIERAAELGLVDSPVAVSADFIRSG